jgi:Mg2+-importing ATPase
MGTIVNDGAGIGVVTHTGTRTSFGRIAIGLGERHAETAFQSGLRAFSALLVRVAVVLSAFVFVVNVLLSRPVVEALLFSLAIAIGITPQLLPAIVTVSLSTGSRRLAHRKVLVKRLVSIEDLGNITLLFTDKTGTLTDGHIEYQRGIEAGATGCSSLELGLLCNDASVAGTDVVSGNALDVALWRAAPAAVEERVRQWTRLSTRPFDHERRWGSVIVEGRHSQRLLVMKGEPERVLARCTSVPTGTARQLHQLYEEGARVVAVASKGVERDAVLAGDVEQRLEFGGFLIFADRVKVDAAASLARLAALGIVVKVITGDSEEVARKVCTDLAMEMLGSLTGDAVDAMDDAELARRIDETTVFARTDPETKARIIRVQRERGADVAFLGDGVNDAVALHHADVGISVDTATDVAKDAADIILLDKDLGVLADGVVEGRRIFANTIKYILMATSSNFGNMFSAACASLFLSFLPMLPTQILLNNLLYDVSQMTIPSDNVDEELLRRPSAWDVAFIRRFMFFFGPISSAFDFATFGLMLWVLNAAPPEFRTGWFVESLATQTLVVFVIRTRRHPFWKSRPSTPLLCTSLTIPVVGILFPYLPFAPKFGFTHLPIAFYCLLALIVVVYLVTIEIAKHHFFEAPASTRPLAIRLPHALRRTHRRATPFSRRRRVVASQ